MNIPTKQLEVFFKKRNDLISELSQGKIDKIAFLEKKLWVNTKLKYETTFKYIFIGRRNV